MIQYRRLFRICGNCLNGSRPWQTFNAWTNGSGSRGFSRAGRRRVRRVTALRFGLTGRSQPKHRRPSRLTTSSPSPGGIIYVSYEYLIWAEGAALPRRRRSCTKIWHRRNLPTSPALTAGRFLGNEMSAVEDLLKGIAGLSIACRIARNVLSAQSLSNFYCALFGGRGIFRTKMEWLFLRIKVGIKTSSRAILSFHLIKCPIESTDRIACLVLDRQLLTQGAELRLCRRCISNVILAPHHQSCCYHRPEVIDPALSRDLGCPRMLRRPSGMRCRGHV